MEKKIKRNLIDALKAENANRELTREKKVDIINAFYDQMAEVGNAKVYTEISAIVGESDIEDLTDESLDKILSIKDEYELNLKKKSVKESELVEESKPVEESNEEEVDEEVRQEEVNLTPEALDEKEEKKAAKKVTEKKSKENKESTEKPVEKKKREKKYTTYLNPNIKISPNNPMLKKVKEMYEINDGNAKAIAIDLGKSLNYVRNCINYLLDKGEINEITH